jgi:hypothetical protein
VNAILASNFFHYFSLQPEQQNKQLGRQGSPHSTEDYFAAFSWLFVLNTV